MATEKRLIDANALAKDLELLAKHEDNFRQSVILGVVHTVKAQPTVDAVEVEDPELMKAIKLLIKQYPHSKASDYVYNPIAHALYHTWKQVDERKDK